MLLKSARPKDKNQGTEKENFWSDGRNERLRIDACFALGEIGADSREAVSELQILRKDPSSAIRLAAELSLWRINPKDKFPDSLLKALREEEHSIDRARLVLQIGSLGPLTKPVVPILIERWREENQYVRDAIAENLRKIDPEAAAKAGIR